MTAFSVSDSMKRDSSTSRPDRNRADAISEKGSGRCAQNDNGSWLETAATTAAEAASDAAHDAEARAGRIA
jgi:hypothetical protein